MSSHNFLPLVIQAGATKSQLTGLTGQQPVGFYTNSTIVSTTLTFNTSPSLNANPVVTLPIKSSANSGATLSWTVGPIGFYGFTQDQIAAFSGITSIQAVAGSTETAGTTIFLSLIPPTSK